MDEFDYDDILDDEDGYDGYEDFDCGWTFVEGQLCDDIGSESCSFFCPHYRAMMEALRTHPHIPPTWAHPEQPEYWQSDGVGDGDEIPF